MYRTLTDGFGQMAAQNWLVPQQKYDLIHYIREAYFKTDNNLQYARVDKAYLAALPRGTSRGPRPVSIEPWSMMDYGPSLSLTVEDGNDRSNIAFKGIAIRARRGAGGDLAGASLGRVRPRYAASGGGLDRAGFHRLGGNQFQRPPPGPSSYRRQGSCAEPLTAPAGLIPNQSFADLRDEADGRSYGPLPRAWAHFRGLYRHGDRVILGYTVGNTEVLESPGLETDPAHPDQSIFTRTLEIGPSPIELMMRVASDETAVGLTEDGPEQPVAA